MFAGMRALTREAIAAAIGDSLLQPEVEALLTRRDRIIKLFEDKIAKSGEAAVLYTMPPL
jgi:hypothetical protein